MNEEVREVVEALAGEYPPPPCPFCKEPLDCLYSREPSLEWNKKTGKFEEAVCFEPKDVHDVLKIGRRPVRFPPPS